MQWITQSVIVSLLVLANLTVSPLAGPETALAGSGATVTTCDEASFDDALSTVKASGGGAVVFDCAGVITFTSQKVIGTDITIMGNGQVIFDGGGNNRLFAVSGSLHLIELTLRNGYGASVGGAILNYGILEVTASTFSDNVAYDPPDSDEGSDDNEFGVSLPPWILELTAGFGVAIHNEGTLRVTASTFDGNSAEVWGGAISTNGFATTEIIASAFHDNAALESGGAIDNGDAATLRRAPSARIARLQMAARR
jgi:predicted outer membrane repeat protein